MKNQRARISDYSFKKWKQFTRFTKWSFKKQNEESVKNLASSLVDNALNSGKIANSQKEWALMYACKDLEGFKSFLDTKNDQVQVPKNNVFANKNTAKTNEFDVVKMMLGD